MNHTHKMQRAAVLLPPELEALVTTMCSPSEQGSGLRSLTLS